MFHIVPHCSTQTNVTYRLEAKCTSSLEKGHVVSSISVLEGILDKHRRKILQIISYLFNYSHKLLPAIAGQSKMIFPQIPTTKVRIQLIRCPRKSSSQLRKNGVPALLFKSRTSSLDNPGSTNFQLISERRFL